MGDEERKARFFELAARFWELRSELEGLIAELRFEVDRKAVRRIMGNLVWANENCTVIGMHQVGEAMNDSMGMSLDGKVV